MLYYCKSVNKLLSAKKLKGGDTMKSGTKDRAEGKLHEVKGKVKETASMV